MEKNKFKRLLSYAIHYSQLLMSWFILNTVRRDLFKKNIWLICEKRDEARDNGYHFYKFIKEKHPEIDAYYVITSDSPDWFKVGKYGDLIIADGWNHCLYFLAARYSISSQQHGAHPFHFSGRMMNHVQKLCNRKLKVVFLQHGITKDKLPLNNFLYDVANIDFFVTSATKEYEFVKKTYQYPEHAIGLVGMARFDNLYTPHIVENQILVMPTWRQWLDLGQDSYSEEKKNKFFESDYFAAYAALLADEYLIQKLRDHGYKLVFYMHYKLQPYVEVFRAFENDVVIIADKASYDVQHLLMSSKMMITDYSSVFFDFAYMDKPLMYYQFDKQQFRQSHYAEGYFSYEEDGFGPCFENWDSMRQYICDMVEKQCMQPEKYALRVKEFFDLRDNQNCVRIYNAISAL